MNGPLLTSIRCRSAVARPVRRTWVPHRVGRVIAHLLLALLGALLVAGRAQAAEELVLHDAAGLHDGWTAARVLADPEGRLALPEVLARLDRFGAPGTRAASLGRRAGAMWILLPVRVPARDAGHWVFDADYASLDRIDLYVLEGRQVRRSVQLGDQVPLAERPLASRGHAVALELPPGQARTLLLRVETSGSMIVPLELHTPAEREASESREQVLQGLVAGAGLAMLLWSLAQWAVLREAMFGLYALTLAGTTGFFAALSGVGPQHLWGASEWLTRNGPPFFILVGVCAAFFFVIRALHVRETNPRVAQVITFCGVVAGTAALAFGLGAIHYNTAQAIGMALGPAPLLLILPTAWRRMREGDRAAFWMLAGWGAYSIGVLSIVCLLAGWLPLNFWTLHGFQFASMIEMASWTMVLGERVDAIRRTAAAVKTERDTLHAMAHTDVLTGLLNRRGLQDALAPMLAAASPRRLLALYVLDLDGFKAVNDRLGHDAGDALLVDVAQRLRAQLRGTDLLARLGGDEFVVAVGGLAAEADAARVGDNLLAAFRNPFVAGGEPCRVGLTIGYALAPPDDTTLEGLMKRADAAMYGGKQAGKNCVRRDAGGAAFAAI